MKKNKIYITTAIDYVNSVPHIGTAYEKIGTDAIARFYRLLDYDVRFQMGNDEHAANVQKAAKEKGQDPKDYCDQMRPKFEKAWQHLNISYDEFIQTSEPRHHESVSKLFQKIYDAGDIYPKDYEGWYCESCETFFTDKDLEDGKCPNHKTKPEWLKEQNYFFKLSKYTDFLLEHIEKHPEFILPEKRRNEVVNFIKAGLEDVSVSRSSFNWGIPLPIKKDHVVYVWFDALINYITGIGYHDDEKLFAKWWENTTHVIGKDITRFHCIIWPAMLQAAGMALPKSVIGHGFVYLKGEKMSKSLGNVVTPLDVVEKYPEFGSDALRYYLLRGSSFGDDGDFTWDSFIERYNADLANGFGNLVSRTLGMIHRYQSGKISPLKEGASTKDAFALLKEAELVSGQIQKQMNPVIAGDVNFHIVLETLWGYISKVDQFIDQQKPWELAKSESSKEKLSVVMTTLVEAIRLISILASAYIPSAVSKVWQGLGFEDLQNLKDVRLQDVQSIPFIKKEFELASQKLMLFPRIEAVKKEEAPKQAAKKNDSKKADVGLISIDDFFKSELRIAKIVTAEKVEDADKLLKLQVEVGQEKRQVVAGIAEYYSTDDLIGKLVVLVANLKPAKIRGIESQGMLLAAKKGKKLFVVTPDQEIASGAKVG
jgi:methionyl-tRNA synthetase